MPAYVQNQPAGSQIAQPSFQLKNRERRGGAVQALLSPEFGFVLDRSGSMASLKDDAIAGFNTLVAEQRATNSESLLSLSLFDHENLVIHDALPLIDVPELTSEVYVPRGGTALSDAIAKMIQQIGRRAKRSSRVLIAILTDGGENSSREFKTPDIFSMITYRRTTYDWQFVFIGPEEALSYARSIGIPQSNVVSFDTDPAGIAQIMCRLSKSMAAYQLGDRRYALKLHN